MPDFMVQLVFPLHFLQTASSFRVFLSPLPASEHAQFGLVTDMTLIRIIGFSPHDNFKLP
jgi:hypothetical protein